MIMQQSDLGLVKNQGENSSAEVTQHISVSPFSTFPARLLHLFDYVAVLRPLLLLPVWTMLLLGYYRGLGEKLAATHSLPLIGGMPVIWRPGREILITLLLYSLLMGGAYILNQLSDSHTDEINSKLYLVARGHVKTSVLEIQSGILFVVSIIAALLQFSGVYVYLILLSAILGVLYSASPVRLKGRPILDLLANACGFGMVAFAVGWTSSAPFSADLILKSVPYVICIAAAFINTTIPDMKGDIQNGDVTTGVFLGIRKSCMTSTILLSMVPFISLFLRDFICLTASVVSLPFFIYMTVTNWDEQSPKLSAITLATKVSLLILSLLIALFIPLYFLLLVATLLLMRLYYQMRFGVRYP
jgi:4-hydroxybenzoate polyprenyltransferase